MQVLLNEQGFVLSFAFIGNMPDAIDAPEPADPMHFAEHYSAYKLIDGQLTFDAEQDKALQNDALLDDLRVRRERECFSVINRGQLWYDNLSAAQRTELQVWYAAWLAVTDTLVVPEWPEWIT
ncbi:MAG: DUF2977 domain-containing protein [Ruminococcaceae bacterium]|nr:DUF2977 domain-containing protein [Oscillospiraceae bacterium]